MIYVTHDQIEAMTLADKVVSSMQQDLPGPPAIGALRSAANKFVASFIGTPPMNIVPARSSAIAGQTKLRLSDAHRVELRIGPPQRVHALSTTERVGAWHSSRTCESRDNGTGHLDGSVVLIERVGSATIAYV